MEINENFHYFSVQYLNCWIETDEPLYWGLQCHCEKARRRALVGIAKKYSVIRSFPKMRDSGGDRLHHVPGLIDNLRIFNEDEQVKVIHLAGAIEETYGRRLVSASSKFLWFKYRSPVIIFDGMAVKCLAELTKCAANGERVTRLELQDYNRYCEVWQKQYAAFQHCIDVACNDLRHAGKYTLADKMSERDLSKLASKTWFKERVFDFFLWHNGRAL